MKPFLSYRLIKDALQRLAKTDYLAKAILDYSEEALRTGDKIKKLNNIKEIQKSISNLGNSSNYLSKMFEDELKEDVSKASNKYDFNELTSIYILNNFMKLCPSKFLSQCYEAIYLLKGKLSEQFSVTMVAAIMLKEVEIIRHLSAEENYGAINNLINFLSLKNDGYDQILYSIYYWVYESKIIPSFIDKETKIDNKKVEKALLDDNDNFPMSIMKHLCSDEQFRGKQKELIALIVNLFIHTGNRNDEITGITNMFFNDAKDLKSEAEFLDLEPVIDMAEKYFEGQNVNFHSYILNYILGIKKLDRREDDKSYGAI